MSNILKKIWILPLFFILYSCASTPEPEQVAEAEGKSENVNSAAQEKAPVWVTVEVDEFFVAQETVKYDDGFIDGYRLYDYNDAGQILKKSHIGSDERIISEELYSYNGDGLLVASQFFSGGDQISYSEFTYNADMLLIEESYFNPEGQLLAVSSYEYDNQGRISKWISGDSGGIPMMYTEYEYKKDMLMQMTYFMPSGEMEGFTKLEYKDGQLVSEASYNANSKLEKKTEYTIENGLVVSEAYYIGNNLIRTVEFEYDDAGNAVIERTINRHGDVIDIVEKEYVVFTVKRTVQQ